MKKQVNLKLLQTGGVISSLAPLITAIIINWNDYVIQSNGSAVKLTIGGSIAVFLIAFSVVGKLKMPSRLTFYTMLLVMVFLLEPVLADLKLLSACALGGELFNSCTFSALAKNYKETITMEKQADINAKAMVKAQEESKNKYSGRV